ncbi:hypothetical protein ACQCX5_00940 [Propionibacteriaceae bacterium G57]|uniref:hypothetical protein n=1 Tax=Aestuariimicrobium sp. G57 TaxID=3418485 RepID=UPI003DA73CF6
MKRWAEFGVDSGIAIVIGAFVVLFGVRLVAGLLKVASDSPPEQQQQAADRLKGGAWIGALERLGTYACVVGGFLPGLAIILAVKGLARYPDLKSHDAGVSERFIIGTFISVLIAVAGGALTNWLTGLT